MRPGLPESVRYQPHLYAMFYGSWSDAAPVPPLAVIVGVSSLN
jgi:hypothetical protein